MADKKQLSLQTQQTDSFPSRHFMSSAFPASNTGAPTVPVQAVPSPAFAPSQDTKITAGAKDSALQKRSKTSAQNRRDGPAKGSTMTLPGMIAGEITYTPTTHRISKAKKGKKVHACEFPGCNKIFTRAEHRKRHEANHNTSPAFQCQIEGCKKPFQRADLLTRHMERQHNVPPDPATKSQYTRSAHSASPSLGSIGAPAYGRRPPSTAPTVPQSTGAMSIGSIIEHNQYSGEYGGPSIRGGLHDLSAQAPIGTAPRSLQPDLLYGFAAAGDSPLYSSSDSCYSPLSDYLPSHQPIGPYYGHEMARAHAVSAESSFQAMVNSPMTHSPVSVGPPTPAWGPKFDPITVPYVGDVSYVSTQPQPQQLQFSSPQWTDANSMPDYELSMPTPQPWTFTKVTY